ncbi:hypothetical protein N665_0349s0002 [Sinapis alba]|nr:hypothetical protein N665_0349s0002 [Sinapis alba]
MDSIELPKRIFSLWEEPFPIKSIVYHTDDSKCFSVVRDALHYNEYEELKESRLGVFLKFKELDFDPVRFSLIEFEQLTGFNCEYIENLETPRCEVTKDMTSFWERIGVSADVGPSSEQIIRACQRCQEWSRDDRMWLGYLAIFTGFIEGSVDGLYEDKRFHEVLYCRWFHTSSSVVDLPCSAELGANYENPIPNKPSPPLLAFKGGK